LKITSTNIAKPTTIIWNGREEYTGIYKNSTNGAVFLGRENVRHDEVSDRKHHGGEFKACYLFSAEQYGYWKNLYPNLDWDWGIFGENLTVSELNEENINIGDIFRVGSALVQITQPREPCYKFGVKFGTQKVLKQFINHGYPGTYVRILEEGFVESGNVFTLVDKAKNSLNIKQFFSLLYSKEKNKAHIELILNNNALPIEKRNKLKLFL